MKISSSGRTPLFFLILTIVFFSTQMLSAQDISGLLGSPVRITTTSREVYQGALYTILADRVELVLANGQIIQILSSEIEKVEGIDADAGKRGLFQDAATNRLMVMPTGFPMKKGEFHVDNQEVVVVTGSYGLSDNVSVWAGISIPGLVLSGRFSYRITRTFGASVGAFAGISWIDGRALLLPYALASFGSPNRNFTAGGAAVFSTTNTGLDGAVAVVGGKVVLTSTSALVSENWFIWDLSKKLPYPSINALGISFRIAGNRLSWDIGAVVPLLVGETLDSPGETSIHGVFGETIIPLPLISLTYRID